MTAIRYCGGVYQEQLLARFHDTRSRDLNFDLNHQAQVTFCPTLVSTQSTLTTKFSAALLGFL
jgi:hypothetical protein